ncbi:MAG: alpha-galactosidase, partial [Clostridia bacterium]|nr:alpha-galactosidase [Clostridia bacterium]
MEFQGKNPVLKGINGDLGDMYAPYRVELTNNYVLKGTDSGRPTHGNFPYFNLEYGNHGTFIAVGWPGSWMTEFKNEGGLTTHVTAGQFKTDLYLEPGQKIRTPLIVLLNYSGRDETDNMNLWRRWFIDCNMRHPDGQRFEPVFCASSGASGMTTQQFLKLINTYTEHDIHLDYLWIDAGWYTNPKGESCSWPETGTLMVDTSRFPDRFADVSARMHELGGKVMLWFEAEVMRCNVQDFLDYMPGFKKEWFLGTAAAGSWLQGELFDLGNPECLDWLLERIYKVLDDGNIDMLRSDFNVNPGEVWRYADELFDEGIKENLYVQGYLKMWDSILERYPSMMIDSCASGGGRNDIETLRRSVPLHISDFWDGNDYGWNLHDAGTGEIIWSAAGSEDNGRGIASDIIASNPGYEFSSSNDRQQHSAKTGNVVSTKSSSMNFRLYWDGSVQDNLADGGYTEAYSITHWTGSKFETVATLDGSSCNTTKRTPNLSCDIFGDWREEVILHDDNNLF